MKYQFAELHQKSNSSPYSSVENISKISSIKNKLYDAYNSYDSDGKNSDGDKRRKIDVNKSVQQPDKNTSTENKSQISSLQQRYRFENTPTSSFENISKINAIKSMLYVPSGAASDMKNNISENELQIETSPPVTDRRREIYTSQKTLESNLNTSENVIAKKSNTVENNLINKTKNILAESIRKTKELSSEMKKQNGIELRVSSPGLTCRKIQLEKTLTSVLNSTKSDIKFENKLTHNYKEINRDSDKDYDRIHADVSQEENLSSISNHDQEQSDSMSAIAKLNNNTGVTKIESKFHAERNFTNHSESSQHKNRGDTSYSESEPAVKNLSPNLHGINGYKGEISSSENKDKTKNVSGRINLKSENNYAVFQKVTAERLQTRDRSNTWTTTDSENELGKTSSSDKQGNLTTDSSEHSKGKSEEKEHQNRRRRLTKKRSKKNKNKSQSFQAKKGRQSVSTSDGDVLESNHTSDDCVNGGSRNFLLENTVCDTDIYSNGVLDVESNNIATYSSTVKENTDNLTSQSSEKKNNSAVESINNTKEALATELTNPLVGNTTHDVNIMKSASMTTVSRIHNPNLVSFPSTEMGGSRSEDEATKIESWKKSKEGPLRSFTNISKVSTLKLQSFTGKSSLFNATKRRAHSSDDQSYCTSYTGSYTDISNAEHIAASPFSMRRRSGVGSEDRFSDRDQEITSRMEKLEEMSQGFQRSRSFLYSVRRHDARRNPLSIAAMEPTPAEKEDSKQAAEALSRLLPSSPFSLISRYTNDLQQHQRMQSQSTGSLEQRPTYSHPEIERGISYDASITGNDLQDFEIVSGDESSHKRTQSVNEFPNSMMIATVKDLINNNINSESKSSGRIQRPKLSPSLVDILKDPVIDNVNTSGINNVSSSDKSKVRTKPVLTISPAPDDEEYYKKLQDSPMPRRRPSYIKANDMMEDSMSMFVVPTVKSTESQEDDGTAKVTKRPTKRTRPRVPVMLTGEEPEESKFQILDFGY